jgi:lysozyme
MQTSEQGIAFIKANEGFVAHVYNDNGKQAIAYGHDLLPGESYPDGITEAAGDALLRQDLAQRFEPAVNALVPSSCTQGQFDACVDFAYNLGIGSLKIMLAHGWSEVPEQMLRWCNVGGTPNAGLLARRQKEASIFQEG